MVTKQVLNQYNDLVAEIHDLEEKIAKIRKELDKIEQQGAVVDTVSGGYGGTQHFRIEGFPYPEYDKKRYLLKIREAQLVSYQIQQMELVNEIERFLQNVDDAAMRRIIDYRIVRQLPWNRVADLMGGDATEDSVRIAFSRFMEKNS